MKRTLGLLVFAVSVVTPRAWAQAPAIGTATTNSRWLDPWRPLGERADLARRLPSTSVSAASLLLPSPGVGLFWTAGNPAALRDELADSRTDYGLGVGRQSGGLHRPLDPVASSSGQAYGFGWTPASERLALLGRVVADRERFDPGTRADVTEPYSTSPFVTLDTSSTATDRTRIALEGVVSVRLGDWSLGTALGHGAREHQTVEAGFVRRARQAMPGITVGLTRKAGSFRFGPYARWRGRSETIVLIERDAEGIAVELEGLRDARPIDILVQYYRRIQERLTGVGWSLGRSRPRGTWALYAERNWLRERLTRQQSNDPASDAWDAAEWASGVAYQRSVRARGIFTLDVRYAALRGEGDVALDSAGVIFRAQERTLLALAEWRLLPSESRWGIVVGAQARLEERRRDSPIVPIAASVTGLTFTTSVELGRNLSERLFATATMAAAQYSANSSFPAPFALGASYRTYIISEYDLLSRPARPWLGAVGLRWNATSASSYWLRAVTEHLSTTRSGPTAFGPEGTRNTVNFIAGVTLRGS